MLTSVAMVGVIAVLSLAFFVRKSREVKAQERARAGEIYLRLGQAKKAISAYKEALHFDRTNSEIWRRLGVVYLRSKDIPEAIRAYEEAGRLAPRDAGIRESLGEAFERAGLHSEAQTEYSKALSLYNAEIIASPRGFLYINIGDVQQRLGNVAKATEAYRSAFAYYEKKNDPNDWYDWELLGDAWLKLDSPEDAISAYEHALKAKPDNESVQMQLRKLKHAQRTP